MKTSITESINPLTRTIDIADHVGIVRLLRQSDAQVFTGYDVWPCLLDEEIIEKLALTAYRLSRHLKNPNSVVAISGAGTSGRLANLHCTQFNRFLRERNLPEVFRALIAGGPSALIQAQESAEDSASVSIKDFKDILDENVDGGMYIGITCGLTATYVAAQLDYIGGHADFNSVVIGFNPVSLARDTEVEGWEKTVKQVIDKALESDRFTLLNPVHGPESITGSTRMKGGSLTKILLDTAFAVAIQILDDEEKPEKERMDISEENLFPLRELLLDILNRYRTAIQSAYANVESIAELVRQAGTALRSGGRIHYLGRGTAGVLGLIDASECPPTFGADLYDVRGYLLEGWEPLGYSNASMKTRGKGYEIDHEYFENQVLPEVSKGDLVVGIAIGNLGENTKRLLSLAAKAKASTALIFVGTEKLKKGDVPEGLDARCLITLDRLGFAPGMFNEAEIALKVCLNALTTGGHTMAGKVFGNVMIDLRISNNKLYFRSVRLVSKLTGVSEDQARRALHHAIFKSEPTAEKLEETPITVYISRALARSKIIPMAVLLATRQFSFAEAEERLAGEPRVRRIIEDIIGQKPEEE